MRRCSRLRLFQTLVSVVQGLPLMAALLPAAELRPALLQGLAIGLGGLDAQLAGASAAALLGVLAASQPGPAGDGSGSSAGSDGGARGGSVNGRGGGAGGGTLDVAFGSKDLLQAVLDDLPALWQQCDRCRPQPDAQIATCGHSGSPCVSRLTSCLARHSAAAFRPGMHNGRRGSKAGYHKGWPTM